MNYMALNSKLLLSKVNIMAAERILRGRLAVSKNLFKNENAAGDWTAMLD